MREILGPLRPPRHPLVLARFGASALRSATGFARSRFEGERARALLAGCCAHSMLSLRTPASAAFGIVLALSAHQVGWPVARGGSQRLADALASHLRSLGGEIETGRWVESLDELAGAGATLLDVTPRQLLRLAGHRLPDRYARRLARYRYGPGVFKLDWALDGPIPWSAAEVVARGHGAPRRHARRDCRLGGGGLEGRAPRPSRSSCSCSRASSIRPAPLRASTPPGPTATCRTAPRAT